MAEEDPYNFEIAIPAAAGGGRAQPVGYGRYSASSSGDEDDDGSSPDVSASEDGEEEDYKPRCNRSSKAMETKPAARAVATAGGGSSALDKAKDFLSKYSSKPVETKTTASASATARRSRVELSMDDDDVSLDSSRDVSRRADSPDEHEHDASSYFEDESPVKIKTEAATRPARADSDDDDDDDGREDEYDEESDAPPPYSAPPASAAISTPASASTSVWKLTPTVSSMQADDEQQSEEAESVASQSEILESQDQSDYRHEAPPPAASQVARASAVQQSAPSESGVYEEEAFEEEPVQASPDARTAVQLAYVEPTQVAVAATAAISEPAFDYSMDFSDDGDEKQSDTKRSAAAPVLSVEHVQSSHHRSSEDDNSDGERSALLESDSSSQASQHLEDPPSVSSHPALVSTKALPLSNEPCNEATDEQVFAPSIAADPERVLVTATDAARTAGMEFEQQEVNATPAFARSAIRRDEEAKKETRGGPVLARKQEEPQERPVSTLKAAATPSDIGIDKQTAQLQPYADRPRPRVVIVRAYETPEAGKPEMKDASTQFTGNHAGIQTELVPDGMHNLQASQRPTPAVFGPQEKRREALDTAAEPAASLSCPEARTTVPTAPSVPLPSYSLEMLQQPLAASTSLYKQQLMALQEQILAKKRETERLVSERMNFQYGSLHGTERFIAGRRPPKLQLWEALMRVDPTLSEKKAKEAARLAQGGFTA